MNPKLSLDESNLPRGWKICGFTEIADVTMGQSPPSSTYNDVGEGLPFFQGKAEFQDFYPVVKKYCSAPVKRAEAGSVLMSIRAPVGPTNIAPEKCCIGRGLAALLPLGGIQTKYLLYVIRSMEQELTKDGTGTTFEAINKQYIEDVRFALPPLDEQNRIVEKIEELFSEVDKGIESLKTAQQQLKIYRQSLLKAAFEGKLTAEWREDNADCLQPAENLLKQIQGERLNRQQAQLETWKAEVKGWETLGKKGKKPAKPRFFKTPDKISEEELAAIAELHPSAIWVKVGHVFDVYVGATPSRSREEYWGGPIPWVSSGEVAFRDISDTTEKITEEGYRNTSTLLHPKGTVMLAMIGEGKTRGQAAVLQIDAAHNQNTAAIRVSETSCDTRLFYYYLLYQYDMTRLLGSGNNQKALNKDRVSNMTYPLFSIEEQRELSITIEQNLSELNKLESQISDDLNLSESLRQAVLKKAFSGQLVSQDPNDEPASSLLERIAKQKQEAMVLAKKAKAAAKKEPKRKAKQ